jgi:hypothetical protein
MISKDKLDDFIDQVENMIDAQDDMWAEEKNYNYRWKNKIKEERYEPARKSARESLEAAIIEIAEKMMVDKK